MFHHDLEEDYVFSLRDDKQAGRGKAARDLVPPMSSPFSLGSAIDDTLETLATALLLVETSQRVAFGVF
jgi:hypothetical protein